MNPVGFMNRPIVIYRTIDTGPDDVYGQPTRTEQVLNVLGEVQQTYSTDPQTGDETQDQTWDLFLPPETVIDGTDEVTIDGIDGKFVVLGPPWPARNPRTQVVTHLETKIRRAR